MDCIPDKDSIKYTCNMEETQGADDNEICDYFSGIIYDRWNH